MDRLLASDRLGLELGLWHGDTFHYLLHRSLPLLLQQRPNYEFRLSLWICDTNLINLATGPRYCEGENRQETEQQKKNGFARHRQKSA